MLPLDAQMKEAFRLYTSYIAAEILNESNADADAAGYMEFPYLAVVRHNPTLSPTWCCYQPQPQASKFQHCLPVDKDHPT